MKQEKNGVHKIAVISDTHGRIREEALPYLQEAELILHAGDFADENTYDRLLSLGQMTAVRGNCDGDWAERLPREITFELYGKTVTMVHNLKKISGKGEKADLIISGHTHKYREKTEGKTLYLNPGSLGLTSTLAMLETDGTGENWKVTRVDLAGESKPGESFDLSSGKLEKAVVDVVSDLQKGKTLEKIMKKRGLSRELTEQIAQIYYTHPGIDTDGILNRIEIAGR